MAVKYRKEGDTMTIESTCLLASLCKVAGDPTQCHRLCEAHVAITSRTALANVPADYRLTTLATSPVRASQPDAYAFVDAYVGTFSRMFDDSARIKSLYLWSASPGTGKTTTAVAVLHEYLIRHYIGSLTRDRQAEQRPVYFLDVNEWQSLYNTFNRSNVPADIGEPASRRYYAWEQLAKQAPFAVLDDVGVRSATEGFRGDLHAVINHRVTNRMPTVYTSNIPLEELTQVYDARLADRIADMTKAVPFVGASKRGFAR